MANAFLKAEQIAATALGLLQREIVLPALVTRKGLADFKGAKGDSINIRVPAIRAGRTRAMRSGTALVADDLAETSVPVALTTHIYDLANITDEELTLDIVSFGEQVLMPQVRAVVEQLENIVALGLTTADWAVNGISYGDAEGACYNAVVNANAVLDSLNVPKAGRVIALGANATAAFLKDARLSRVDQSGSDSALRDAIIGRVAGFTIVSSNALQVNEGFAFHMSAYALGVVAPVVPDGATFGKGMDSNGLAMRWLRDYDPTYARDRSLVDVFAGGSSIEEYTPGTSSGQRRNRRGVELLYTGTGPVSG